MAKTKKRFYWLTLPIVTVGMLLPVPLAAQSPVLSSQQIEAIKTHCVQAQSSLAKFELSELVTRVDRGRVYEQLLRQMTALNTRFVGHKIDAAEQLEITNNLQATVGRFREAYDRTYDKTLLAAARMDCKAKPADFYNTIVKAREERAVIAVHVAEINRLINQYQVALTKARSTLASAEAHN